MSRCWYCFGVRSRKLEFRLGRGFDDLIVGRQQKLVSGEQRRRHRWWSLGGSFIDLACRYGLVFFIGGVFAVLGWQPMKFMLRGRADAVIMFKERTQNRPDLAIPIRYDGNGVVVFDKARASKGLTVVQELLSGGPQLAASAVRDASYSAISFWATISGTSS